MLNSPWTRILFLAFVLACGALSAGVNSCQGGSQNVDWDLYVTKTAEQLQTMGASYVDNEETTFEMCIAGVFIKGGGDATVSWGVPIKQAIEADQHSGQLAAFTIDPSPCLGHEGVPESQAEIDASKEEVAKILAAALPPTVLGLTTASYAAASAGDGNACVGLKVAADVLNPAGEITMHVLEVVENPGEPFLVPGPSWDADWCPVD